jgi:hypothetical protein
MYVPDYYNIFSNTDSEVPDSFEINGRYRINEPWIDPHEPVINYRKQEESFAKNRRARKKRNRKK